MNKLSIFNNYYCPWTYPINWITNVKTFFKSFKYGFQRITRGYSDRDCWNLDNTLLIYLAQTLNWLSEHSHGYPGYGEFDTYEKWQKYLQELALDFLKIAYPEIYFKNPYEDQWYQQFKKVNMDYNSYFLKVTNKEIDKLYREYENNIQQEKMNLFNESWIKLGKIFFHLWD